MSRLVACLSIALAFGCAQARVTRIVIDETAAAAGPRRAARPIAYEQIAGRAFGELDPDAAGQRASSRTSSSAKDADGKVRYVATFVLYKPVDTDAGQRPDVARRAQPRPRVRDAPQPSARSATSLLASAWQGDNAGGTAVRPDGVAWPACSGCSCRWRAAPTARASPARCSARIVNRSGPDVAAADRADQPGALQAGEPRHGEGEARLARRRDAARRGDRRGRRSRRPTGPGRAATPTSRSPARPTRRRSA